ncbi:malto-oligosyltrehalose synthase [Devosia sp. 2618]|uniref:malto-oligosyltrehalose synthase n=1 Tax=Devosia sp. 2618 TaxID=3156454 RepID=UPI0033967062
MTVPRATYRLQLNQHFTFADAKALVPYLNALGISHAYLSPILKAQPGSTHGYDTVDHTQINPELGTLDDFRALAHVLKQHGMGIILDFVPNHMGVGGADNTLWLDVLKHGSASQYADWFDIDWNAARPGMQGKILVPFLGESYAEALVTGSLRLKPDGDGFAVWAYDTHKLPIRDEDAAKLSLDAIAAHTGIPGNAESWSALDALIANQHWRIAHFTVASDEINYRRFFINSELAGIRIERPEVFDHAHSLIFALIGEGHVDGLRIDHVDGLLDPTAYLQTLRARSPRPIYLAVEKILAPHEQLRAEWPVEGTTGYEVGAMLTRVLVRPEAEHKLSTAYADFIGPVTSPAEEEFRCKLRIMDNELSAELTTLTRQVAAIAWSSKFTADLTEAALRRALREIIAHLSVYRTYADEKGMSPRDHREIALAIAKALLTRPHTPAAVFDFVAALLCGNLPPAYDVAAITAAIGRFQQYTGPVMAKGLEDTALYRYNRLVALNEVGAHPDRFSTSIAAFHDSNRRRLKTHPHSMLATSTHDTKHGEDLRAIIAAIGDEPQIWHAATRAWQAMLPPHAIAASDLYLLLQLMLGGWLINGDLTNFANRLKAAMTKSAREARQHSDWAVINAEYEGKVSDLIDDLLANPEFLASFHSVHEPLVAIGRRKALIQLGLKLTMPGVPDIYRGAEDWEQSFVDPDNRRSLDFTRLAKALAAPFEGRDDKMILTQTLLQLRRRLPSLFSEGNYEAIDLGPDLLAFRRTHNGDSLTLVADLSRGHTSSLPIQRASPATTIYGSAAGPLWIGMS